MNKMLFEKMKPEQMKISEQIKTKSFKFTFVIYTFHYICYLISFWFTPEATNIYLEISLRSFFKGSPSLWSASHCLCSTENTFRVHAEQQRNITCTYACA